MPTLKPLHYLTLAGVLVLGTGGAFVARGRIAAAAPAKVATVEVKQGDLSATVNATGSVASPAQSKLSFKSPGRLAQLLVAVGDSVAPGQSLARIDDSDLLVALAQAQASYTSALAKLQQTRAGAKPEELAAARAQLDSSRMKLEQTRAVAQGPDLAAAHSQLESARIKLAQLLAGGRPEDVASAQAQLNAASAKFTALENPRPQDLAAAQSQLETARIKLAQLQSPRPEDVRSAEAQFASARAKLQALTSPRPEDLAAAQAALDQAQTKLAQLVDQPLTAKPEDVANAELAVANAQVTYDKTLADASNADKPGGPTRQTVDAAVKQALIALQTAHNNLTKLKSQGPSEWDVRGQQQAVESARANLAKLRSPSPADVQAAQAAVEQAQTTLDKLLSPSPFDVQAAQESVNAAQIALDKLRSPSPADVAAARQPVVAAQAALDKLLTPTELDVAAAQQAVAQAQAGVDKLLNANGYDVQSAQFALAQQQANLDLKKIGPTAQDILVATAAVEQAAAQIKQAEENLGAATLTAPFGGYVAATGVNPGELAGAGTAVVTLVDTRPVRVDVLVNETDIPSVKPGQAVNVTFEALPAQAVTGKVAVVVRVPTVQQSVVSYQVQIQLDAAPAEDVLPGMTASAEIVTSTRSKTLVVPNLGIRTIAGVKTVEVLEADGKTASRQVETGLSSEQGTEILSGLRPGELVVVSPAAAATRPGPGR